MTKIREVQPTLARRTAIAAVVLVVFAMLAANSAFAEQRFPEVLSVKVRASSNGTFDFDVTVSSPYDTTRPTATPMGSASSQKVAKSWASANSGTITRTSSRLLETCTR